MAELTDRLTVKQGTISNQEAYAKLLIQQKTERDGEGTMNKETAMDIAEQNLEEERAYFCQIESNILGFTETSRNLNELEITNMYVTDPTKRKEIETLMVKHLVEYAQNKGLERVYTIIHKESDDTKRREEILKSNGFEVYNPDKLSAWTWYNIWLNQEPAPKTDSPDD